MERWRKTIGVVAFAAVVVAVDVVDLTTSFLGVAFLVIAVVGSTVHLIMYLLLLPRPRCPVTSRLSLYSSCMATP